MSIELYNHPGIARQQDGSLLLTFRTKQEAKQVLAQVWGMSQGLNEAKEVSLWDNGDALLQIEIRFPDLDFSDVVEATTQNYNQLYRLKITSKRWPPQLRSSAVSHGVHAEIGMTKGLDAEERLKVLDICSIFKLSTARARQIAKRAAKLPIEDRTTFINNLNECKDEDELHDKLDGSKTTRARYLGVKGSNLEFSWEEALVDLDSDLDFVVDLRQKCLVHLDGTPMI